ncbi:unnamed protein product [Symbiodinium sp. KB8]|nr:unnamed protein product [Symbiodinium sp. KB8]
MRPSVDAIAQDVHAFFQMSRPRGKPAIKSDQVRIQAWILKRLISIFGRSARRGHVPRELAMKKIYEAAGIPLPESVSHAYMCRTNLTDHVRLGDDDDDASCGKGVSSDSASDSEDAESESDFSEDRSV